MIIIVCSAELHSLGYPYERLEENCRDQRRHNDATRSSAAEII